MGRIFALDYGSKRIGVAVSDETKKIAFPKPYILTKEKEKLRQLIRNYEVEKILLGLPKNLSGQETKASSAVRKFGDWLQKSTGLVVGYIDERFTTQEVLRVLRGEKRRKIKSLVDSLVAQRMLQRYLKKF